MFVHRVLVVKLVLHEIGQTTEFRDEPSEESDLMHRLERRRDVAALGEDLQEGRVHAGVPGERAVHALLESATAAFGRGPDAA